MPEGSTEAPFRESTRTPLTTDVHLQFGETEAMIGRTADLSAGGMFVAARSPKPVGTLVRFEILLTDVEQPLMGFGEVVWIRVRREGPNRLPGMGIQFRYLLGEGQKILEEHLVRLPTPHPVIDPVREVLRAAGRASGPAVARPAEVPFPELAAPGSAPVLPRLEPSPESAGRGPAAPGFSAQPAAPLPAVPFSAAPHSGAPHSGAPHSAAPLRAGSFPAAPPTTVGPHAAPPHRGMGDPIPPRELPPREPSPAGAGERSPGRWRRLVLFLALLGILVVVLLVVPSPVRELLLPSSGPEIDLTPLPPPPAPPARQEPVPEETAVGETGGGETPDGELADGETSIGATTPEEIVADPVPPPRAPPTVAGAEAPAGGTRDDLASPGADPGTASPGATRIESITWTPEGGKTVVTLRGEAPIRPGSIDRLRLEAGSPRELVRLDGIREPYRETRIVVGTPELLRIRIGYHPEQGEGQLHLVFDLPDPAVSIVSVEPSGRDVVITLRRP